MKQDRTKQTSYKVYCGCHGKRGKSLQADAGSWVPHIVWPPSVTPQIVWEKEKGGWFPPFTLLCQLHGHSRRCWLQSCSRHWSFIHHKLLLVYPSVQDRELPGRDLTNGLYTNTQMSGVYGHMQNWYVRRVLGFLCMLRFNSVSSGSAAELGVSHGPEEKGLLSIRGQSPGISRHLYLAISHTPADPHLYHPTTEMPSKLPTPCRGWRVGCRILPGETLSSNQGWTVLKPLHGSPPWEPPNSRAAVNGSVHSWAPTPGQSVGLVDSLCALALTRLFDAWPP